MRKLNIFFLNHLSCYINSLADSLCQLGHRVYYQTSWDMKEVEAGIKYFKPDMLITVGMDKPMFQSLDAIAQLCHTYKLLHVYWATEDSIHHAGISLPYVERVRPDIVWTIHPDCVERYNEIGVTSYYLNFAYNPRLFTPKSRHPIEPYDISLVGTSHLETRTFRYDSLQQLLFPYIESEFQYGVNVWGFNWLEKNELLMQEFGVSIPHHWVHDYLPYKQTADVYHTSKIMLGVQNARDQVSQRTFEILGAGAFMIASRTEALQNMFEESRELVLTSSSEETLELTRYYLQHEEERIAIGMRAHNKVLANYTFSNRLNSILNKMKKRFK